jgi:hypothetical protein
LRRIVTALRTEDLSNTLNKKGNKSCKRNHISYHDKRVILIDHRFLIRVDASATVICYDMAIQSNTNEISTAPFDEWEVPTRLDALQAIWSS